jgi:hypothetical protein
MSNKSKTNVIEAVEEAENLEFTGYNVLDDSIASVVQAFQKFKHGLGKVEHLLAMFIGIAESEIKNQISMDELILGFSLKEDEDSIEKTVFDSFQLNYQAQLKQRKKIGQLIQFRICSVLKKFIQEGNQKLLYLKKECSEIIKTINAIVSELDTNKASTLELIRKQKNGDKMKMMEICRRFNEDRLSANKSLGSLFKHKISRICLQIKQCEESRKNLILTAFDLFANIQVEMNYSTRCFIEKMEKISSSANISGDLLYFDELLENQKEEISSSAYIPYDLPIPLDGEDTLLSPPESFGKIKVDKQMLRQESVKDSLTRYSEDKDDSERNFPSFAEDLPRNFQSHHIRPTNLFNSPKSSDSLEDSSESNQKKMEIQSEKKEKPAIKPKPKDFKFADEFANQKVDTEDNEEFPISDIKQTRIKTIENNDIRTSKPKKHPNAIFVMIPLEEERHE